MDLTAFAFGVLSAALLISFVILGIQYVAHKRDISAALKHETFALDRARAAELRSAQQIDAMLDRISTEPRLELRPASGSVVIDPKVRKYITDHEADDQAWNEYRESSEDGDE